MTDVETLLQRIRAVKEGPFDANGFEQNHLTLGQRVADGINDFCGSLVFVWLHLLWFVGWIVLNGDAVGRWRFDPYPFGLLTLIVSLEAIFLSTFIMISQNRQAAKDRLLAESTYRINCQMERVMNLLVEHIELQHRAMLDKLAIIEGEEREELALIREIRSDSDADF